MTIRLINSEHAPTPMGPYTQALEVTNTKRRLYISGQAPVDSNGEVAGSFKGQAETVWKNIIAQLKAADMSVENIVKATIYLTDRAHIQENREVRLVALEGHTPALTVVLAGMFDESWMLEIEAIAEI